jgi:hypothetical protein
VDDRDRVSKSGVRFEVSFISFSEPEGSIDGKNWIELDRRDNCHEIAGLNRSATFSISRREFVQQIRLRQHGKDSSGAANLTVSAIELFGDVVNI